MHSQVFSEKEINCARIEGVDFLSAPSNLPLSDTNFHDFADENHFWIKRRFAAINGLLAGEIVGKDAMEIGCGRGVTSLMIEKQYNLEIACCDIDLKVLRKAAAIKRRYYYNINDRQKAWAKRFSTVFLLDVLEHIDNPAHFLKSVNFHMQPAGLLVINVPALNFLYSKYDTAQGHIKRYGLSGLKNELSAAGFTIKKSGFWGLSMVPLLFMRKIVLNLLPVREAVRVGFQPKFSFIAKLLDFSLSIEERLLPVKPLGSSLLVLAQKEKDSY